MLQDRPRTLSRRGAIVLLCALSAACAPAAPPASAPAPTPEARAAHPALIPEPVSVQLSARDSFVLTATTQIVADAPEAARVADYLAARLRPATGYPLPVGSQANAGAPVIALRLVSDLQVGAEGYRLSIAHDSVAIVANRPAGLFHGVQTLRQLLPAAVEAGGLRRVSWSVPTGEINDYP
ncbi:MAG TPA: glycoside hydrolase family 20 zincin-like fold domain-containing protein, partial [Longimicrobiaceae bacterium]|nr:glycoside hydrolase family 20 zincin-like fold domain-containing protein [Longimicrobiaceae bacterium]